MTQVLDSKSKNGPLSNSLDSAHPSVRIIKEKCAGCQECVTRCPVGALDMDPHKWVALADSSICVGCRQCERTCPYGAIHVAGPMIVGPSGPLNLYHPKGLIGDVTEIRQGFTSWDEAIAEANRCLDCPDPTCMLGCPAHNAIPDFIAAIRAKDLNAAHAVLEKTSMWPDACSRVCDWKTQCEGSCTWSLAGGEPVAIGRLERFITDQMAVKDIEVTSDAAKGITVAIVGAGPAGLSAATQLVKAGAAVTIYERDRNTGGVMSWGIPSYVLPDQIVDRPIESLIKAGVTLKTGVALGRDIHIEDLKKQYSAVILTHGASTPIKLPLPGVDLAGVEDATYFLTNAKSELAKEKPEAIYDGANVVVLGAGNTAMDVARSARRLGAKVIAIDWMKEEFAKVRPDEIQEARDEGVKVNFGNTVESIVGQNGVVAGVVIRTTTQKSASQLPRLTKEPGTTHHCDKVILAMGYRVEDLGEAKLPKLPHPPQKPKGPIPDRRWIGSGILNSPYTKVGNLALARESMLEDARLPISDGIWAAGDVLVGPSTVVSAMAQGREAARALIEALSSPKSKKK